ncbi:MAG: helix-turn-helix domain-containing protein [Clostridia bacterium]|nr:helix-turn-helix domain-containing protein [Clostridia bacterium]
MKAITTVGERLRLIKEWQQSGLTVSEWCRRNGIHPNTFCNWIHRSRKQGLLETPAVIPLCRVYCRN